MEVLEKIKNVKLSLLCKMQSGGTPSRKENSYWENGKILWAKISDLENSSDGFIFTTEEKITDAGLVSINNRIFSENTLFLAMYGSVGKTAISKVKMSTNQAILGINVIDNSLLDINYLKYWLNSTKKELLDKAVGVALKNISLGIVKDLEIPLPPLSIQKAIAEKLDKADALRKKDKELLAQYDELAQAIFIDMFGDPVRNEKGWDITKVEEVCSKIYGGGTPSKSKPEYYEGDIPWVTPKDMKYDYIVDSRDHINEDAVTSSSTKLIPVDSLLMVIRSGILKHTLPLGINKVEVTINQDMKAFIPNLSKTNSIFLKGFFKAVEAYLLTKVRAVTADNFEFSQIKELNFPLVPLKLQTQFEEKIKNIENQKAIVKQQAQQSEDLFQALLQESFNFN